MRQPRNLPRYLQIAETLQDEIESGVFAIGARLPSERELSARFGVTRMTLRQALDQLEGRGIIARRRSIGTFVAAPKITLYPGTQLDLATSMSLVMVERRAAGESLAAQLDIPVADEIYCIAWQHRLHSQPILLEQVSIATARFSPPQQIGQRNGHLQDYFMQEYGLSTRHFRRTLESVIASTFEAQMLRIAAGSAVLLEQCMLVADDDIPVAACANLYRSDRFRIAFDVQP